MLLVTLDINVIRDAIDPSRDGHAAATEILRLIRSGRLKAQVTSRLGLDVPEGDLRDEIESLPELESSRVGTPARCDISIVDGPDYLVSESEDEDLEAAMDLVFPGATRESLRHRNRIADIDHMFGHRASSADYFVTREKSMLVRAKALSGKFGIEVVGPTELLELIVDDFGL